ncbi:MAG TPA: hypothetical protein VHX88_09495 [Solirubrobacteraceae bacterium]|jgi:hypothetical protein|nr:hypothetical protein [Solirubrobacteraceae bacterium]
MSEPEPPEQEPSDGVNVGAWLDTDESWRPEGEAPVDPAPYEPSPWERFVAWIARKRAS